MTSILVSIVVYFIAAYVIRRRLEEMGIPKGMTRGTVIFVVAAAVAYGAAYLVDLVVS
jgi:Fe2+ transport system protein FeoA